MSEKNKINMQIWLLALASSLLLSIPYIIPHSGVVSLFAFVPLFLAEQLAHNSGKRRFFHIAYTSFLVWNLITTFWVWFATPAGAVAAFLLNSLQMALLFTLFRWMRKFTNGFLPYIFFCIIWLAWEHSYQTWQITWPWLLLGNSFATSIKHIQWYEFTGVLGGSLWILLANMLIHRIILLKNRKKPIRVSVASVAILIFFPMILSHILYYNYEEEKAPAHFSVLQPNIDPYTDKFGGMTLAQQTTLLLELAGEASEEAVSSGDLSSGGAPAGDIASGDLSSGGAPAGDITSGDLSSGGAPTGDITSGIAPSAVITSGEALSEKSPVGNIIVAPETFIFAERWNTRLQENLPSANPPYRRIEGWVREENLQGRKTDFIIGAVSYNGEDYFNTALFLAPQGDSAISVEPEFYHKSKLVVLAESNPFKNGPFKFMDKLVSGMAGGIGDFGTQEYRTVFQGEQGVKIGTAICYESVFGDFYREWALGGANVMSIITNDGWWRDTPGHKQHLNYARLRAIENRRSIARSANTGISAFINQRGDIVQQTSWWERGYLTGELNLNEEKTIFTIHGDIIGRLSRFLAFLFLLMGVARKIGKKYASR